MKRISNIIRLFLCSTVLATGLSSCENLDINSPGLSNAEIVEGLKSALSVGTDTSVSILHQVKGYYGGNLVKILLPKEAEVITKNISKIDRKRAV